MFKVFNRITGEEITDAYVYYLTPDGKLWFYDHELDILQPAGSVHEVRYV